MNKDKVTEIEEPCTATPCNQSELIEPLGTAWQPIETAPKDGTDILVLSKYGIIFQAVWTFNKLNRQYRWMHHDGWFPDHNMPIYWMPLPVPPKL